MSTQDENNAHAELREALASGNLEKFKDVLAQTESSADFRGDLLLEAVQRDKVAIVKLLLEKEASDCPPARVGLLLHTACKEGSVDTAAYLAGLGQEAGMTPANVADILLRFSPPHIHPDLVRKVTQDPAGQKPLLDAMLNTACFHKVCAVMPLLLELGADPNTQDGFLLPLMTRDPADTYFGSRETYLSTLDKFLSRYHPHPLYHMMTLTLLADKIISGEQDPETVHLILKHGADPWVYGCFCEKHYQQKFTEAGKPDEAAYWKGVFMQACEDYTNRHRNLFQEKFSEDYGAAFAGGVPALSLAAKARCLNAVMDFAIRTGARSITAEMLTIKTGEGQTLLELAGDRGDIALLFDPRYWMQADPKVIDKVQASLSDAAKSTLDLASYRAEINRYSLLQKAPSLKLRKGPI